MTTEAEIQQQVRLLSRGDVRLFRFQCGHFELADGRRITVGVPGMSDLIGWKRMLIGPEHVGMELAVFVAIECKSAKGKPSDAQLAFIRLVNEMGGLSGIARSDDDAKEILGGR
jgi:hypothetical protein